ncbi:MAG: glycosyltransferase family A protein [Lachnospiraceae bacterium]
MQLELLVSCMNADIPKLIQKMNLQSAAIIVNQCDRYGVEQIGNICTFHMDERGVGLSRNHALMRASKEIILFGDEDIEYVDGYEQLVIQEFEKYPKADGLLFEVDVDASRRTYHNDTFGRVGLLTCGRYPAYSMAFRTKKLRKAGTSFSLLFGGGAKYSNGEDSLFLRDCIKKGMKLYKTPVRLGVEVPRPSTWFTGYHEKFFVDRGVLFHFLYGNLAPVWAFRFAFFKRSEMCQDIPWKKAFAFILKGIKEGKNI